MAGRSTPDPELIPSLVSNAWSQHQVQMLLQSELHIQLPDHCLPSGEIAVQRKPIIKLTKVNQILNIFSSIFLYRIFLLGLS